MTVPTVPNRSLQHLAAREHDRSHRSLPLKGGTEGTLPQTMRIESKEGLRRACDLVPMVADIFGRTTGSSTDLLSLPTSEKKSGEKSW